MVIYEPVIGKQSVNNIQDYPKLIEFINQGGVVIKEKQTANSTKKVKLAGEKSSC